MKKLKRFFLACLALVLTVPLLSFTNVSAGAISAMSVTGTGITSNSAPLNSAITPTINYTTSTGLTADGQTIRITLNGMSVASGQTLSAADLTMTGCTSNALEDSPGTGNNGAHEVTITNGAAGNDNPVILITLDSTAGPVAPSCTAGAKTLVIAASQLVSHDTTAGNYAIVVTTSLDNGAFFFYVADENDVQIEADVDTELSFVIRNAADNADQANVNGATVGPNLCDLGTLNTATASTCSYRLKVSTNAVNGYYVSVSVDDDLNNDTDTQFIDNTATGSAPTNPNEGYNIILAAGSATIGAVTECPGTATVNCLNDSINWANATGTIFSNTVASVMYSVSGPNSPSGTDTTNTALMTHRAIAASGTPSGEYNQLATYTVTAVF